MSSLSFMISGLKTLKVIGRKKVAFHLDQLVLIQKQPVDGRYFWVCRMAETDAHDYIAGVACDAHEMNLETQRDAEESALTHLQSVHRASGGERRDPHRGRERRARELERWTARRRAEAERKAGGPAELRDVKW